MGCWFGKNRIEEQEINISESLQQPLITSWDQLVAPGGEVDSTVLADPPSSRSYRIRRRSFNKNKYSQHMDIKKWAAGVQKSNSTYMDY